MGIFLTDLDVEYISNDRRFAIVKKRSVTNSEDEGHFIVDFTRKKMIRSNDEGRALKNLVSRGWKLLKLSDDSLSDPYVIAWSENQKVLAMISRQQGNDKFNCSQPKILMEKVHTEPKFSLDNGLLDCVDKDERIIVEHKTNATRIEVVKIQHRLSQIDLKWMWQAGKDSIFFVALEDNAE